MCTRVNHSVPLLRFTCPFSFRGFVVLSFELSCFILFSEAWEGVSIGSACNRRHGRFPMCCGHKTKIQKVLYGNAVSTVDNAKIERITKATKNKIKLNNKYIKYIEV